MCLSLTYNFMPFHNPKVNCYCLFSSLPVKLRRIKLRARALQGRLVHRKGVRQVKVVSGIFYIISMNFHFVSRRLSSSSPRPSINFWEKLRRYLMNTGSRSKTVNYCTIIQSTNFRLIVFVSRECQWGFPNTFFGIFSILETKGEFFFAVSICIHCYAFR